MVRVKNISGQKMRVGSYRLCAGHILNIKDGTDITTYIDKGLLEVVAENDTNK